MCLFPLLRRIKNAVHFCGFRLFVGWLCFFLSLKSSDRRELQTTFTYYHFRHRSAVEYIDFESISSTWKKAKGIRHWLSLDTPTALNLFDSNVRGVWVIGCRFIWFHFFFHRFLLLNTSSTFWWALQENKNENNALPMNCYEFIFISLSFKILNQTIDFTCKWLEK